MSKFNTAVKTQTVENLAGGQAYAQSPEIELTSILLTSFVNDQFYRSASDTIARVQAIVPKVDPEYGAKLAIYARKEFGMRSISHVLASELAPYLSKKPFARDFYTAIIKRPDDMTEIIAYHQGRGEKLSSAMKVGLAKAFNFFNGYSLAKYRGEGKAKKLIDVVNLVHPAATEKNAEALKQLVDGTLRSTETWEAKLSGGQDANDTWNELLKERKLGYLALVRNLRNILKDAPDAVQLACEELTNAEKVAKSLIMPFQLITAYKELNGTDANSRLVRDALGKAIELSCQNVPNMPNTLVVVDNSGSMSSSVSGGSLRCAEAGAAFGMILAKRSNADIMEFGNHARYIQYDLRDSVLDFASQFQSLNKVGHGTNFQSILETANKKYDRIVIFSDMQGWVGYYSPVEKLKAYKKKYDVNPFVYSVDLAGHGSLQFPEDKVFCLAGFSGEMFTLMEKLEADKNAMVNTIRALDFSEYLPQ